MRRLQSGLTVMLCVVGAFIVLFFMPSEAQAHVSVHDAPFEVAQEVEDPEGHCHGEIECVMTLFPASFGDVLIRDSQTPEHLAAGNIGFTPAETSRDPPVPIL